MLGRDSRWNEKDGGCSREGGLSDDKFGILEMAGIAEN